jgi:multiple sugar transport system substrate-binding protein
VIAESGLFVPALRSAVRSAGFANAHKRISNLGVLTGGPTHAQGLPVTPAWPKIVALMDRNLGPVLRGAQPATALKDGLTPKVDEVLRTA